MSNVLAISLTTGAAIDTEGLIVLKVHQTESGDYVLIDGMKRIEEALIESIKYPGRRYELSLVVEVSPIAERVRRINCF